MFKPTACMMFTETLTDNQNLSAVLEGLIIITPIIAITLFIAVLIKMSKNRDLTLNIKMLENLILNQKEKEFKEALGIGCCSVIIAICIIIMIIAYANA